jgi:hypothetical protein
MERLWTRKYWYFRINPHTTADEKRIGFEGWLLLATIV